MAGGLKAAFRHEQRTDKTGGNRHHQTDINQIAGQQAGTRRDQRGDNKFRPSRQGKYRRI